jgi:translocation and assembly module TamB
VTTARGALDVTGEYTAYGQDLEIVEGRLLYSATPLDNPTLQVRAMREIREQTVGLRITGSASEPDLEIYAEPPLEQAEAVSYLVLGRPLNSATSAESGQLSQAAAAIGGNFLAERLGGRLGFDTFEVGDSGSLGGTAFTVGKYLSPKLYISYGVALFDEGEILTLRYLLTEHFEVELESGVESRGGVNYTIER